MKTVEIREAFLRYFEEQGHQRVPSSSLVPGNDPTLLFTNAGMNQFKDTFLGTDPRPYNRATSSQRCVRAGGKHNDLENVGYTARHHTFFEMLGNFSFGDYFKREAIKFAWHFLTEVLGLPEERLWVTVHISDDEAASIWLDEMKVSPDRFSRLDEDNFWQMGDTGPCGPCSEVFYDHGADVPGGPPGSENDDLDRYIEIWNLVFMQYNRDASGHMEPLPSPSVDTGMGLERIAAVMQGVHSNYEIDLFQALIKAAAEILKVENLKENSLRVIVDHIRSCAFLIADGVVPSNEGRGYVLRRIIRRAVRHGNKLGAKTTFFHQLVAELVAQMGAAYPELAKQQHHIEKALLAEEEQFAKTLDKGMALLSQAITDLEGKTIPGDVIFKLYDTHGFPVDLTGDIAREKGLALDIPGYEQAMAEQRLNSQEAGSFKIDYNDVLTLDGETDFIGYEQLSGDAKVVALLRDGEPCEVLAAESKGVVVLDRTPFYAESGGQVGDSGYLKNDKVVLQVSDTTKASGHHLHHVLVASGEVRVGDVVSTTVDAHVRSDIRLNHSATHLLHAALREILGDHVVQKGSLVDANRLRFDFAHPEAINAETLAKLELRVNEQVRANTPISTELMAMDQAIESGAMALFGEKYDDEVRVLSMGADRFSVELCGGTHAERTGDIGLFRIVSESGVAAGVRRLEAVTGSGALAVLHRQDKELQETCELVKARPDTLSAKVLMLRDHAREQEKALERLKQKLAAAAGDDLGSAAVDVAGCKVLAARLDGVDPKSLRDTVDQLKNKLGEAVILLAAVDGEKIALTAGVTKSLSSEVKAGDLMKHFAAKLGGKGGGRPDMAQGGGSDVAALDAVLAEVPAWVAQQRES